MSDEMFELMEEREELVWIVRDAHEIARLAQERGMATGILPAVSSDVADAQAELDEFDAKYPEVLAAIKAERQEAADRSMWN